MATPQPIAVDISELSATPQAQPTADPFSSVGGTAHASTATPISVDMSDLQSEDEFKSSQAQSSTLTPENTPLAAKPIPDQPLPSRQRQEFLRKTGGGSVTEKGIGEANRTAEIAAGGLVASEVGAPLLGKMLGPTVGHVMEFLGIGNEAAEAAAKPAEQEIQKVATGVYDQYGKEIFKDVPMEA